MLTYLLKCKCNKKLQKTNYFFKRNFKKTFVFSANNHYLCCLKQKYIFD